MSLKNVFKKTLALGLAASVFAGCSDGSAAGSGSSGGSKDSYKIGVLEVQLNDESTNRAEYFRSYIGPEYNCEFMFSEAISDLEAALTFLENAADASTTIRLKTTQNSLL